MAPSRYAKFGQLPVCHDIFIHTYIYIYPPTPAAQGGARKGKGFSDTALVAIFSVLYPPTPTSSTTTTTITTTQQAAAGSSRQQQAAAGISRQQQTQADAAAVSATAAVQQLAARKIVFF